MVVFAFAGFDEAGTVEAVAAPLAQWAVNHRDELSEGYGVDALSAADLLHAGVPDVEIDAVVGALGHATYASSLEQVAAGISHPHKEQVLSGTELFVIQSEDGSRDCFLTRACDAYTFEAYEEASVPVLGLSRRTVRTEMRWIVGDDGVEVLAMRQLVPEPTAFDVALMAIDQQYGLTLVLPEAEGATRLEAIWVDARVIGLELPEGYAVRQAVGRMQAAATELDAWAAGQ